MGSFSCPYYKVSPKDKSNNRPHRPQVGGFFEPLSFMDGLCRGKLGFWELTFHQFKNDLIYKARRDEHGIHQRFFHEATEAFPRYRLDGLFYTSED